MDVNVGFSTLVACCKCHDPIDYMYSHLVDKFRMGYQIITTSSFKGIAPLMKIVSKFKNRKKGKERILNVQQHRNIFTFFSFCSSRLSSAALSSLNC